MAGTSSLGMGFLSPYARKLPGTTSRAASPTSRRPASAGGSAMRSSSHSSSGRGCKVSLTTPPVSPPSAAGPVLLRGAPRAASSSSASVGRSRAKAKRQTGLEVDSPLGLREQDPMSSMTTLHSGFKAEDHCPRSVSPASPGSMQQLRLNSKKRAQDVGQHSHNSLGVREPDPMSSMTTLHGCMQPGRSLGHSSGSPASPASRMNSKKKVKDIGLSDSSSMGVREPDPMSSMTTLHGRKHLDESDHQSSTSPPQHFRPGTASNLGLRNRQQRFTWHGTSKKIQPQSVNSPSSLTTAAQSFASQTVTLPSREMNVTEDEWQQRVMLMSSFESYRGEDIAEAWAAPEAQDDIRRSASHPRCHSTPSERERRRSATAAWASSSSGTSGAASTISSTLSVTVSSRPPTAGAQRSNSKDTLRPTPVLVRAASEPVPVQKSALIAASSLSSGAARSEIARHHTQSLHLLAQELKLPFENLKMAADIFKRHADSPENPNLFSRMLSMTNFKEVLSHICGVHGVGELDQDFATTAFHCADRDGNGSMDIREFSIWYSSFSFSEEMVLDKDERSIRDMARRLGVDPVDVDRYKRSYDKFDLDGSGAIELDEFEALLHKMLKVPEGSIPQKRVENLWRMADTDNAGELDFPKFCMFYLKYFDNAGDGTDPFSDFYRNIRRVNLA